MRAFTLIAGMALLTVATASAKDASAPHYTIDATLADAGGVIAKPSLVAAEGQPARIEISDRPDRNYAITLKAQTAAKGRLFLSAIVDVTSPTTGRIQATPMLEVVPGRTATIELGEDRGTIKPFRLDVTVSRATP